MTETHSVTLVSQVPLGEGREFEVAGKMIAVFRTLTGSVYATQARCPHRAAPLADGLLAGTTLLCPFHLWKFDMVTGAALMGECGITVYDAQVSERGDICITIDDRETV